MAAAVGGGGNSSSGGSIPITELFWSLIDKADRKFSKVLELPNYARSRNDSDFHKAFKIYTQLWKLQQEHRQKLVDAGLRRWEIGEIASRIAQLFYGQYQRTSDSGYLSEAFVFYEAILSREYFKGEGLGMGAGSGQQQQEMGLVNKQMRFLARFLIVCLVIGRREMVNRLAGQLKGLVDEYKKSFQEAEFKEWKHVVQEVIRFLKADSSFMNMRPIRYSFVYDQHPDSLPSTISHNSKRRLVLRDAILSSYYLNEVKFTELTLDTFRMLQCLEWEPCGSFSLKGGADGSLNATGSNGVSLLQDIRDPTLPPNPRKVILYRPSITHLLTVLSTICEELPLDGILLIYLSAAGDCGVNHPTKWSPGVSQNAPERFVGSSDHDAASPLSSPVDSPTEVSPESKDNNQSNNRGYLWLGSRGSKGSNYLYPCDLLPFTRKPLFLIIDSNNSHAYKAIHGEEKGETAAMLLSPSSRAPSMVASTDSARYQHGSQFTMFLTAPVQAFCFLIGMSVVNLDKETYDKAEKLLSLSLSEWESSLVTSDLLHPVWVEALGDPLLRRLILRFIFCRAVLGLYSATFGQEEFLPSCLPPLPESVSPEDPTSQAAVLRLANFFGATNHFSSSQGISPPALTEDDDPVPATTS